MHVTSLLSRRDSKCSSILIEFHFRYLTILRFRRVNFGPRKSPYELVHEYAPGGGLVVDRSP